MIELYLADLVTGDYSEKIFDLRLHAFIELGEQLAAYRKRMYDKRLTDEIEEKRAEYIMQTDNKAEMDKVLHPDYNNDPKYGIDAEELIFWCECSLRYPLPDAAYKRYMALRGKYYGNGA